MRHFARVYAKRGAKSGKMPCQMPLLVPYFPTTTPCESELFAPDGQIVACEGSHNVKGYSEKFTFLALCQVEHHHLLGREFSANSMHKGNF